MTAVSRRLDLDWRESEHHAAPVHHFPEKHLIIAGTGRAGTSFLVRYLTELGLDTTLARKGDQVDWNVEANAGLENQLISTPGLPYVIKSPWIGEYVDQILAQQRWKIDAFIVPVRDLVEAATSRVVLEQRAIHQHNPWMAEELESPWEAYGHTPGGLVYSLNPLDQARLLAVQFHRLVLKAAEAGVPLVFPVFPRIATDWRYLHECLAPVLPKRIEERVARAAHAKVADAAKVRVRGEIGMDQRGAVVHGRTQRGAPRFPSATEIDNIALRRETSRLRQELNQLISAQELCGQTVSRLGSEISGLRAENLELESAGTALEAKIDKLRRRSIKFKMRRLLRFVRAGTA